MNTGCAVTDAPLRRHQRVAQRLAALLARNGHQHRVEACGDHWHVHADPLRFAREAIHAAEHRRRRKQAPT